MQKKNSLKIAALFAGIVFAAAPAHGPKVPQPIIIAAPELEDTAQWAALVGAVKAETLIRSDELAVTVTRAIEDAASEFDLNPWLVMSLIRIESSGRPDVVSHVGAVGLTQVLPRTADEIAGKLRVAEYDLRDPATNVRFGSFYLAGLLARFDGSEAAALAAYNYGPTAVARMIRNGEPLPTVYATKILTRVASL